MSESIKPKTYAAFLSNPQETYKTRIVALYQHDTEEVMKPNIYALYDESTENIVSQKFDLSRNLSNTESVKFDLSRTVTDGQNISAKFDLSRVVSKSVSESFDLKRIVSSSNIHITEPFDLVRNVSRTVLEKFDLSRKISENSEHAVSEKYDLSRVLNRNVSADFDLSRKLHILLVQNHATYRIVKNTVTQNHSTRRLLSGTVSIRYDTCVKPTNVVVYQPTKITVPGGGRLASFSIEIRESSICDSVTLGIVNSPLIPRDTVRGNLLDYDYDMIVQSTSHQGILSTIQTMGDWKKVTGTVLRYPDFDGSGKAKKSAGLSPKIYSSYSGYTLNISVGVVGSIDSNKNNPTTKASYHIDYLAECMGFSSCEKYFDDFTPLNGCANETSTYISLVSNFFSWTKDIPWRQINIFARDNVLYAVQRGHEPNTVDITNMRHTRPTVLREIVMLYKSRTTLNDAKAYINLNLEQTGKDTKSDNNGNVLSYNTGSAGHKLGYDNAGRPIYHKTDNPDGSTDEISYSYSGDAYTTSVYERHVHTPKGGGKPQITETWHTNIGNGHEITDCSDDGKNVSGSALTTNRTNEFSKNHGATYTATASIADMAYTYTIDDTYGNSLTWTTGDEGGATNPFPIVGGGDDYFEEVKSYNGKKIQETLTLDIVSPVRNGKPDYTHIIDYRDAILLDGNKYYLVSNSVNFTTKEFNQSLKIIRWV